LKTFGEAMLPEDCEVLPEVFLADKRCCCYWVWSVQTDERLHC